ncbi:proton-coupled folate transporter [Elysia marginata]|uniref:Proton-coupled folate transporter n=1 Tax=Elysia marginata TaxID=1093978 RepID=A0AAV4FBT7_9GAST|nr:proton-coupled folate transporter [Elysia marginata]
MSKIKKSWMGKGSGSTQHLVDKAQDYKEDQRKRRNMLTLIITSSLNMLGYGIYRTAYSQWIYVRFEMDVMGANFSLLDEFAAKDPCFRGNHSDSEFKEQLNVAQANSAHFGVLTNLCVLLPSFFFNLLLGAYADQIGRRILFIVPLAGTTIRTAIVCGVAFWDLSLNFILIGYAICGVCGNYIAFVMAMYVYTADNTSQGKNRSFLMVFASTLDKSKVEQVSLIEGVKGIFSFYLDEPINPLYKRKDFILLGLVFFAYTSSIGSSISTIFLMNEPFCWGAKQIGYVNSAFGLGHAVLSTLVMRLLQYFFSDEVLVIFSLLSSASVRFIFAFANYDWEIYIAYATGAIEVSVLAIIRAILTRMVPKEKRGSLLASITVMETATLAASGAGLNELYSHTVREWRGLTFFVIGCIICVSAALMIVYKVVISLRSRPHASIPLEDSDTDFLEVSGGWIVISDRRKEPLLNIQDSAL